MNAFQTSRHSLLTLLKNTKFVLGYSSFLEHMFSTLKVLGLISTTIKIKFTTFTYESNLLNIFDILLYTVTVSSF
jgi:hypothetical protein